MKNILVLHGPNLNLLGTREPTVYGSTTLATLNERLQTLASSSGFHLNALQSNSESVLIDAVHQSKKEQVDHIIMNPGAFSHTSIALRDAMLAVSIPFIEVHISNIYAREAFRHHSYFSDIAIGVICGLGTDGYVLALQSIIQTR